jgi:hypothetical protein
MPENLLGSLLKAELAELDDLAQAWKNLHFKTSPPIMNIPLVLLIYDNSKAKLKIKSKVFHPQF